MGRAPLAKVFYADNGSAGVEVALKMAFHWFHNRGEHTRTKFIALENGYHGETLGAWRWATSRCTGGSMRRC